jgi:hypothetical protein
MRCGARLHSAARVRQRGLKRRGDSPSTSNEDGRRPIEPINSTIRSHALVPKAADEATTKTAIASDAPGMQRDLAPRNIAI